MPESRFHGWVVAAAAACVLLVRLGGPPLWDDDEPKNAACSLAMLDAADWVVPTFNGRLRIEKPPLVNWLQMAGFAVCGRNETGARIASALLTIGSCLLTWRTGCHLLGPTVGLFGGLAMATCVWTAVGGRAATPDAPLLFATTLALFLFVRGIGGRRAATTEESASAPGPPPECISLGPRLAACVGAACGVATLAKGPVGFVLPALAFGLFAGWRSRPRTAGDWRRTVAGLRPLTVGLAAAAVAAPWYAWVALRTDGAWLHGFLVVHNVGRFTAPMEGHSGSLLYYPGVLAVGLFPWSIVLAAMVAHACCILRSPADDRRRPLQLLACWAVAWVGCFSCAGTKLPGYIWPAYPALAIATGLFLADWARGRVAFAWPAIPTWAFAASNGCPCFRPADGASERIAGSVMRIAWAILAVAGVGLAIGLPTAAGRLAPGAEWLGWLGLIPIGAAAAAWQGQSAGLPHRALAALAVGGCLLVSLLASVAAEAFSDAQGSRALVRQLSTVAGDCQWACLWNVPPSLVFYTGARIERLAAIDDVAAHLRRHPRARVVVDGRQEPLVTAVLPPGCGVLARVPTLDRHDVLLIGRLPGCDSPLAVND